MSIYIAKGGEDAKNNINKYNACIIPARPFEPYYGKIFKKQKNE